LEEESELRALEEAERELEEQEASRTIRERRRGSVSISRIDMISIPSSTRSSRSSSLIVSKPPFYQLNTRQTQPNDSTDSLASETTTDPSVDDVEELHVAQTQYIPAQSISRAISRRLSRARELVPIVSPTSAAMIIGVAVEANTVEHRPDEHSVAVSASTTTVYSAGTLRTRRSTSGLNERATFFAKAKDITSKLRRKSVAALTPASR
jgi:hypothetical protein